MSYNEVIDLVRRSKAVVDMMPDAQAGLSLRPLEALFMKKKLITNFRQIKEFSFYHPDNVFIMGEDHPEKLRDFLSVPFNEKVALYINYYDFSEWIKRFDGNNNE